MSDCAGAPEIFIPDFGDMPQGVRFLLTVLERWADARGSIDASEAELAAYTGMGETTVRRHLAWAAKEAKPWVSRSERRRRADGTLTGYRYWLRLEKFGQSAGHRSNRAVAVDVVAGHGADVSGAVDNPPAESSGGDARPPLDCDTPPPDASGGASDSSGGEAPENRRYANAPRERARAALPLPSSSHFLSFPWRDEAMKVKAGDVLAVCGEGLGDLGLQQHRLLKSLAWVLEPDGPWAAFDFALDVLPVVKRKTGPGRSSKLWDFALLTENIEVHRAKRLRPPGELKSRKAAMAFAPPAVDAAEARAKRMDALRREIAAIDRGDGQPFMLPNKERSLSGEWLKDAYGRVRAADAAELARLEAEGM